MINSNNKSLLNFIKGVNINSKYDYEDPTYLGFMVMFNLSDDVKSPLFNEQASSSYSAINYLRNINRPTEAALLTRFKTVLGAVSTDYDYMIQSISGLDNINKWTPGQNWRGKDLTLTFDCLESIDQKMNYMQQCYLKSMYDWTYMRKLIPYNLQFFSMNVLVYEIRNFRTTVQTAAQESDNTSDTIKSATIKLANNIPAQLYTFDYCTFDFNDSSGFLSELNNGDFSKEVSFKFKINIGRVREKLSFPLFGTIIEPLLINSKQNFNLNDPGSSLLSEANREVLKPLYGTSDERSAASDVNMLSSSNDKAKLNLKDRSEQRLKDELSANKKILEANANTLKSDAITLPNTLANSAINNVTSRIKGLSLGNVYDIRNQPLSFTLRTLSNAAGMPDLGNVFNSALDKVFRPNGTRQLGDIRAQDVNKKEDPDSLGNVNSI